MIESINTYTTLTRNSAASKTETGENSELFKQLLGQAVQSQTTQESGSIQDATTSTGALSELSSITDIALETTFSDIESKTDELLEKLSLYSSQLEDTNISLKDIDTLLEDINSSAGNLLQESDNSESTDQELIDIIRECAIMAHSEYIKFQRGDYLDSVA